MIDLVIFDCDGVLVDSEVVSNRVYAEYLTAQGFPHSAQECNAKYLGMSDVHVQKLFEDSGRSLPDTFLSDINIVINDELSKSLEPIQGVETILKSIDIPYCVASSGTPTKIRNSLTKTGLITYFDGNLFSFDQVENGKPAPDLFLFAAYQMGVDPASTIVVEDSKAGVMAGVLAGMIVVGFTGGSHIPMGHAESLLDLGAHYILTDMRKLKNLLASF
ncbi:MAG: HAD superfamily hydrolase (TIGR01509 family) [Polaribacter sp.]|jgi:HAD superfamily hydrolase (TIGR01509 family)